EGALLGDEFAELLVEAGVDVFAVDRDGDVLLARADVLDLDRLAELNRLRLLPLLPLLGSRVGFRGGDRGIDVGFGGDGGVLSVGHGGVLPPAALYGPEVKKAERPWNGRTVREPLGFRESG